METKGEIIQKLNLTDILLLCFVIVGVLNLYVLHSDSINKYSLCQWMILATSYIIIRRSHRKKWILCFIFLIGSIETFLVILQSFGWLVNNHTQFHITGSFGNPAPLGGVLAITISTVYGFYSLQPSKRWFKSFVLGMLILLAIACFLSDSRASWVAALTGCLYIWYVRKGKRHLRIYVYATCLLTAFVLALGSYYYKKDSADGRLLIWRVSLSMIADAPLTGHGIGTFEKKYMYYQAKYFEENTDSKFCILADNIIYPYNELLHIGVELGIPGMIISLLFSGIIFRHSDSSKDNIVYRGAFLSLLLFSLFSYTSHVFLLLLLGALLLGGITDKKVLLSFRCRKYIFLWWGICILTIYAACQKYYEYTLLEKHLKKIYSSHSSNTMQKSEYYLKAHWNELQCFPRFLDIYAQYFYKHHSAAESLPVLQQTATIIPTSEIFCDLGDLYVKLKKVEKAVECYQIASNMIPCRIIPKYKLFQLYRSTKDFTKMQQTGMDILSTLVKVENTQTLLIKQEVRDELTHLLKSDLSMQKRTFHQTKKPSAFKRFSHLAIAYPSESRLKANL